MKYREPPEGALRFPAPPKFTSHDDTPEEYAVEICDEAAGGCVIWGRFSSYRERPEWVWNVSPRGLVRHLLEQLGQVPPRAASTFLPAPRFCVRCLRAFRDHHALSFGPDGLVHRNVPPEPGECSPRGYEWWQLDVEEMVHIVEVALAEDQERSKGQ